MSKSEHIKTIRELADRIGRPSSTVHAWTCHEGWTLGKGPWDDRWQTYAEINRFLQRHIKGSTPVGWTLAHWMACEFAPIESRVFGPFEELEPEVFAHARVVDWLEYAREQQAISMASILELSGENADTRKSPEEWQQLDNQSMPHKFVVMANESYERLAEKTRTRASQEKQQTPKRKPAKVTR